MAPWLWWMDEKTGRWRQIGEMKPATNSRTKRQLGGRRRFYIGDIPTDKLSVINIDILWKCCYVRAQAYTMTDKGEQPVSGAVVTLIGRENTDQEQYYGFTNDVTNTHGIACIPAWCESDVFLQSKMYLRSGGEHGQLIPDKIILEKLPSVLNASIVEGNASSSFKFTTKISSNVGPIFGGDEKLKCLDPDENLLAFQFLFNVINTPKIGVDDFGSWPPGHPLSWYTKDASRPDNERTKCFVKVLVEIENYDLQVPSSPSLVIVQSFTPNYRRKYGFSIREIPREDEVRYNVTSASTCVEYRCSEVGRETLLVVSTFGNPCSPSEIPVEPYRPLCNPSVVYSHLKHTNASIYSASIYAPVNISDGKLGLYTGPGKIAEQRCLVGRVEDVGYTVVGEAFRAYDFCVTRRPSSPRTLCRRSFTDETYG